jgi:hypothetical protein
MAEPLFQYTGPKQSVTVFPSYIRLDAKDDSEYFAISKIGAISDTNTHGSLSVVHVFITGLDKASSDKAFYFADNNAKAQFINTLLTLI